MAAGAEARHRPIRAEIGLVEVEVAAEITAATLARPADKTVLRSVCHPHPDLGPPMPTDRAPPEGCGEVEEIVAETVADLA